MNNFSYMIMLQVPAVGVIHHKLTSIRLTVCSVNRSHETYTCRFFRLAQKGKLLERFLYERSVQTKQES
jgi:hypothetical protein